MVKMMLIISIPIIVFMYVFLLFINEISDKTIFFGVRIPIGYDKREDLVKLKREYKKKFSLYILLSAIIYFILMVTFQNQSVLIFVLYIFAIPMIMTLVHYKIHLKAKEIKKIQGWVLESKSKVTVDLTYRNNKKDKVVVSNWWFLIPAYMCIMGAIIASKYDNYIFVPFQILITVLFYGMNLMIKRAKQNINGGDINLVRASSRRVRYGYSKISIISAILMNISFLIYSILFVTYNDSQALWMISFGVLIFTVIYDVAYSIKLAREKHNVEVDSEELSGSIIINRDDDDNYKLGMFYYNEKDPAIMVEKRVGVGWDFNYAKTTSKIITGFIGLLILGTVVSVAYIVPASMEEPKVIFKDNSIKIDQKLYSKEIKYSNIESVEILDKLDNSLLFKKDGSAVGNLYMGNFNIKGLGSAKVYILDSTKEVIKIKLKDNSYVLINCADKNETDEIMKEIKDKMQ